MMAKRLNIALLVVQLALAALMQISYAQTRHVVGDALGWSIPPGGPSVYVNWASGKKFNVGDVLVFRFTTGAHDVTEVTKAAFDACNPASPVSTSKNGPANITLNKPGEHYFICSFPGHCSAGQKLHVTVSAASSSPAPQPSSTAPPPRAAASSPTPTQAPSTQPTAAAPSPTPANAQGPAAGPATYTVGGNMGWSIPSGSPNAYQSWVRGKSFNVGDILVFNFTNGTHNVAEVTKQAYDSCNTNKPISLTTNPPVRVTLNKHGEHYFLCTFPGHCAAGQKLAVNVGGTSSGAKTPSSAPSPATSAETPSGSATPPPTGATSPSSEGGASTTPPTEGNFAPSLGMNGVSATFLTAVVAILVY